MAAGAAEAGAAAIDDNDEREGDGQDDKNGFVRAPATIVAWREGATPRNRAEDATRRRKAGCDGGWRERGGGEREDGEWFYRPSMLTSLNSNEGHKQP